MKIKVNGGEAFLVMLVVTTTIVLLITAFPLTSYFPSTFSADATTCGGHGKDNSQTSKDLGKEEKQKDKSNRGDDSRQTSKDLGKEEKQEESPQVTGQDASDNEESGEIIEGETDVNQELLDELRGGQTVKDGGTDVGEESEGETDVNQELLDELRGGQTSK
jgi:hypothetical protein